jgi:hypothetical protein
MTDRLLAILAFALLALFLGVLIWYVPKLDLGVVCLATLALVAYDFFLSGGRRRNGR